jgi:hypothetical protein
MAWSIVGSIILVWALDRHARRRVLAGILVFALLAAYFASTALVWRAKHFRMVCNASMADRTRSFRISRAEPMRRARSPRRSGTTGGRR